MMSVGSCSEGIRPSRGLIRNLKHVQKREIYITQTHCVQKSELKTDRTMRSDCTSGTREEQCSRVALKDLQDFLKE